MSVSKHRHAHPQHAQDQANSKSNKRVVAGGLIIAAAAAFALSKFFKSRQLQDVETFVLKSDNGTEAHIRPLGCCIQSTLSATLLGRAAHGAIGF